MAKIISVISGKGGVGKTFFTINFAYSLARQNQKCLVLDFDLFHPNVQIYLDDNLGKNFNYLNQVIMETKNYNDAIYQHKNGFFVMPSSVFFEDIVNLDISKLKVATLLNNLSNYFDYILIDSPVGINDISKIILSCSKYSIVVTSNNKADFIDNQKMIEFSRFHKNIPVGFVVNKANEFGKKDMNFLIDYFSLPKLGEIPYVKKNDFNLIFKDKKILNSLDDINKNFIKIMEL